MPLSNDELLDALGVTVIRYWKNGAVDYKRIPELQSLALEQYRAAPREETRVTTT
jgi:hypothetical protein